jgi:hypothetical protein
MYLNAPITLSFFLNISYFSIILSHSCCFFFSLSQSSMPIGKQSATEGSNHAVDRKKAAQACVKAIK